MRKFHAAALAATLVLGAHIGIAVGASAAPALSASARDAVLAALDDEYKTHATYAVTLETFGDARPFSNIINAEARHIDMLKTLMAKYEIAVPVNPYIAGDKRPAKPASLLAACQIGVTAEIDNVKLYDNKLLPAVAAYDDIAAVMKQLRDASQNNHLPAFERCVDRGGMADGGGPGAGHGKGRGHGMGHGMGPKT